ncbi:MAG: hypothetical protein A3G41_07350 [Elusimicrobia bacterium RIFCSPLOWO2_12_FULL_59_9]|nr:MAG: hypothetical protein A3G41_07350 [Elusimicrobia bacterium RIFCSPLOWO2_12_FULL_59_9]
MSYLTVAVGLVCAAWLGWFIYSRRRARRLVESGGMRSSSGPEEASAAPWHGDFCGVGSPLEKLITDEPQWEKLWSQAFRQKAPRVDFSRRFAAAVFLGGQTTGGYSVEFEPPSEEDGKLVVSFRVQAPSPGLYVIQALTQPYVVQVFEKTGLPVLLRRL